MEKKTKRTVGDGCQSTIRCWLSSPTEPQNFGSQTAGPPEVRRSRSWEQVQAAAKPAGTIFTTQTPSIPPGAAQRAKSRGPSSAKQNSICPFPTKRQGQHERYKRTHGRDGEVVGPMHEVPPPSAAGFSETHSYSHPGAITSGRWRYCQHPILRCSVGAALHSPEASLPCRGARSLERPIKARVRVLSIGGCTVA